MTARILMFMLWLSVWLALSWPPRLRSVIVGIVASSIAYVMTSDMFEWKARIRFRPLRMLYFVYYVAVFLWECVKANFDVAYRVIHPDMPIRPGTIRVRTDLKSDVALTLLANSITLTPGTTCVDIDKEAGVVYVHCLNLKDGYDPSSTKLPVVEKFDRILKKVFE
jgi:multicomponent Na+:H+ antiporter subunit E